MSASDGNGITRPTRRFRFDGMAGSRGGTPGVDAAGGHSGRRFVTLAVLGVLLLWGSLYLAFRDWRAGYRARAAFGATRVAAAIDPMAEAVPPGIAPDAWRGAVARTHALLAGLTAANLLDLAQMQALRKEVLGHVDRARARPDRAPAELAALWDGIADRAGPVLMARYPRPEILPPRPDRPASRPQPRTPSG